MFLMILILRLGILYYRYWYWDLAFFLIDTDNDTDTWHSFLSILILILIPASIMILRRYRESRQSLANTKARFLWLDAFKSRSNAFLKHNSPTKGNLTLIWTNEWNEYLFIDTGVKKMKWFLSSHEVPFPATSDRRSRVAGNGTEWEVKTIELS